MKRTMKNPKAAKRVTKSIRLTSEEAKEPAHLLEETAYAEAALTRQWVISGMQQFRVTEAIRACQDGHVDLRMAAERARPTCSHRIPSNSRETAAEKQSARRFLC